jgi:hypothetical protein
MPPPQPVIQPATDSPGPSPSQRGMPLATTCSPLTVSHRSISLAPWHEGHERSTLISCQHLVALHLVHAPLVEPCKLASPQPRPRLAYELCRKPCRSDCGGGGHSALPLLCWHRPLLNSLSRPAEPPGTTLTRIASRSGRGSRPRQSLRQEPTRLTPSPAMKSTDPRKRIKTEQSFGNSAAHLKADTNQLRVRQPVINSEPDSHTESTRHKTHIPPTTASHRLVPAGPIRRK